MKDEKSAQQAADAAAYQAQNNPAWVPADFETVIWKSVKTKGGAYVTIQGAIKSKDATEGMSVQQAIHDFLQSL